jgi:P-type Cu+ transporter
MPKSKTDEHNIQSACFHCGEDCGPFPVEYDDKSFCCSGCRTVFEILNSSDACDYYRFEKHPGIRAENNLTGSRYAYLDNDEIQKDLLEFSDNGISKVKLFIPYIHCSSCIWLLENLKKLEPGIIQSSVNFAAKEVTVTYRENELSLRKLVELLVSINYIPQLNFDSLKKTKKRKTERNTLYRLGVAGFCFGNIMLFSFPAYLSVDDSIERLLRENFGLLNLLFGMVVAFYSGSVFMTSAYKGLKKKYVSIDLPIAVGILVLFFRSGYEILSGTGSGYMDSLAGFVFFLSIGRWYQEMTYQALSFDRDYRSYFPVAVTIISDEGTESIIPLKKLKTGMRILIRNQELIPADSLLVKGSGSIDYSFVTGESTPVTRNAGDRIFAGGRQVGTACELIVEREVVQSRLTELWNQDVTGQDKQTRWDSFLDKISRYFVIAILVLATISGIAWLITDPGKSFLVITSILIVACPCALAMTYPFSLGGTMRIFGRNNFYLKKMGVVEVLAKIDTIVFDKTGTITQNNTPDPDFSAFPATHENLGLLASLTKQSTHPASVAIYRRLHGVSKFPVNEFREYPGKGVEGSVNNKWIRLGSEEFVTGQKNGDSETSRIFVSIDKEPAGYIQIRHKYRLGMEKVLARLSEKYEIHLLSGDNDSELEFLRTYFPSRDLMHFNQLPGDKLEYIRQLKRSGKKVLMIGDGLNDAGALKESDCGISIADDVYHFSPACDAILESARFEHLASFLKFPAITMRIVTTAMVISFLYNIVGLSFAISGNLSPIVSAILMPLSSVTIVAFSTLSVSLSARFYGIK